MSNTCPDCAVAPGVQHEYGCDVARCTGCGTQHLMCGFMSNCEGGEPTVWKGTWPGDVEVEEYQLQDLNDLYDLAGQGELKWSREAERWIRQEQS